jgi:hypothetical protein
MQPKFTIAPGQKFGHLTVIAEDSDRSRPYVRRWFCRCECGTVTSVQGSNLPNGHTTSCGCQRSKVTSQRNIKHGFALKIPEYSVWMGIRARCKNVRGIGYRNYGGRGITICSEWDDFARFYADMGARPSPEHSIDRIDNDGPYAPWNCQWATRSEQNSNRRVNHFMTHDGDTLTLKEWSSRTGIHAPTLIQRLKRGWTVAKTLSAPVQKRRPSGK